MKLLFSIIVFVWFLAGAIGAWRLDEFDGEHWLKIVKGPITLSEALDEDPVSYPGP